MNVTVGVCAYNEERNIRALLSDVLTQRGLPQDPKVVVVASGCTDNTVGIVREIARDEPRVVLVEEQVRSGKARAINRILTMCPSGLLVLADADVRLAPDSVREVLRAFRDETIGVAGGLPVIGNLEDGPIAKSAAIIWRVMRRALTQLSLRGELAFVMGELYGFRTSLLRRIPDETVNEDAYIASFARTQGFRVAVAPEAIFVTKVPSSVPDYLVQRRRVAYGHLLIKAQTGEFATSMEGIALNHAQILLRAMIREAASRPSSIIRALPVLELEVAVRILALLDLATGKQHTIWKRIGTTK